MCSLAEIQNANHLLCIFLHAVRTAGTMKPEFFRCDISAAKFWYTNGSATDVGIADRVRAGAAAVFPEKGKALLARVSGPQTAGRGELLAGQKKVAEVAAAALSEQEFQQSHPTRTPPNQLISMCTAL